MTEQVRYLLKFCLPISLLGAWLAFWGTGSATNKGLERSAKLMSDRAMALALDGAASLEGSSGLDQEKDGSAAFEARWRALRQMAVNFENLNGEKGAEILSLRPDPRGGFMKVFAPEGQRFARARPSSLVDRAFSGRKPVAGELTGEFLEAAAPLLEEGRSESVVYVRVPTASHFSYAAGTRARAWVVGFLAFFCLLGLSYLLRPRLGRDLQKLEEDLDALQESGALHGRLEPRKGSVVMAASMKFNAVIDRIHQVLASVKKGADLVSGSSQRVSLTAGEVSRMANEVATTIQQVAKGTEDQSTRTSELNTIIQAVSESAQGNRRKAEETAAASEGSSEIAQTIHDLAQDAVSKTEKLSRDIRSAAEVVYALGANSEKIGEVTDIIRTVADQTNLLALNAAIEAARAGDAGRGFAVVADEVRKLAEGSAASADQIAAMIGEIQRSAQDAVASMQKSSEGVAEGSEVISRVGAGLSQIIDGVRRTSQLASEIAASAREQVSRSNSGAQRIEEINAIAEETAASTEQVAASTQQATASMEELTATSAQLAEMARELQGLVAKFDVKG